MESELLFDSSLMLVQMTLAGCGWHEDVRACVCGGGGWRPGKPSSVFAQRPGQEECACIVATTFSALPMPGHLSPAAEAQENHCRNNKSKMLDKIKSLSTKVKNQHEECQCLRREKKKRRLKIYIYSEPVQDQTAKLICSSFNPCSAPSSQFPSSPSIDFQHGPLP